jgi:MFS family permease
MENIVFTTLPKRRIILAYIICGLASFFAVYIFFIQVAPGVMASELMSSFAINATGLGLLGSAFYWANSIMQIPAGVLMDKFGSRKVLSCGVALAALGTFIFAVTDIFNLAILGRLLVGVGSTGGFIGTYYLVNNWFPHKYFSAIAGIMHLLASIGSMFGATPLAQTVDLFGWRETMGAIGIFTFGLALLYIIFLRDKPIDGTSYGIEGERETKRGSNLNSAKIFIYSIRHDQIRWIAICGFLGWIPVPTIGAVWGVPFLMKAYDCTSTGAANALIAFWVGSAIGSVVLCSISEFLSSRKIPLYIAFIIEVISSTIIIMSPNFLPYWCVLMALFMLGFSVCMQTLTFCVVKDNADPRAFAASASINNMGAMLGGALMPLLMGFLLDLHSKTKGLNNLNIYSISDYQLAFIILPLAGIAGILITRFFLKETHCRLNIKPIID